MSTPVVPAPGGRAPARRGPRGAPARGGPARGLRRVALVGILGLGAGLLAPSCETQRFPRPMEPRREPLPPGDVAPHPPGPQEVLVLRLSDPVQVRPAGETAAYPLFFYDKRVRLRSGAWVLCAAGGRCELLWPGETSSLLLADEGVVVVGEPSRGEPIATLRKVTTGKVMLAPGERIALPGGAVLAGEPDVTSGPFLLDRRRDDLLRLVNQSKTLALVLYRDVEIELAPGEQVDLPLLAEGVAPFPVDPTAETHEVGHARLAIAGDVETERVGEALRVRAVGPASVRGLGVVVRLEPGEAVVIGPDGAVAPAPPAAAPPAAESPRGEGAEAPGEEGLDEPEESMP